MILCLHFLDALFKTHRLIVIFTYYLLLNETHLNYLSNYSYYLQLSVVKNHMQQINVMQSRVQLFHCTFTALLLQVLAV